VISTRIGTGVTFVNQDGVTGLTVPPRDAGAIAGAIETLAADAALRSRLGSQARARALNEFTAERMVERTSRVYAALGAASS